MKKFSNFMIKARFIIFGILMVLFIGSIFLIPHVVINKDMTKYLPDGSSMRQGIEIIDKEFPGTLDQKDIKVMFTELDDAEKELVYNKLKGIENVTKVTYDKSEAYNKGVFTLYILSSNYSYKSPEELRIEKDVKNLFNDYNVIVQHTMYATTTIPTFVLILAFSALTIILFIMCSSWIDPILFLITIGIAVCLNFGTNYFLPSVSESTFSLSAILQLVLSMDYSIILMNSYRQEKEENNKAPVEAMKVAYSKAFPSILGSGLTTIIGLLMLIFMQFKLGMDLGIVMAKGVALSMICVFTILPTLIIWCDKLIFKLSKREVKIRMRKVVRYEFRHRFQILTLFIVIFFGAMFFQTYTKVTFAEVKNDRIGNVFTPANNVLIVYDNKDEGKINALMDNISKDKDVNFALSYKTTLALPLKAYEFKDAIKQMGDSVPDIPIELIKMLYYDMYNEGKALKPLTVVELYDFMINKVIPSDKVGGLIPDDVKDILLKMKPIVNKEFLLNPLTTTELKQIINMEEDKLGLLYSVYYMLNENYVPNKVTLPNFVKFLKESILTNPLIKDQIPDTVIKDIEKLETLTNKTIITTKLDHISIARTLSLPQELVDNIFMFKFASVNEKLSLHEFISYTISDIIPNPVFNKYFTDESIANLNITYNIMNATINDTLFNEKDLANFIKIDQNPIMNQMMLKLLLTYNDYVQDSTKFKVSPKNLVNFVATTLINIPQFSEMIKEEYKPIISLANTIIIGIVDDTKYTPNEVFDLIKSFSPDIKLNYIEIAYLYYYSQVEYNDNFRLSIEQVMNHLTNNIVNDERFKPFITDELKESLAKASVELANNKKQLVGDNHSLIVLDLKVSEESVETTEFFNRLDDLCKNTFSNDYHFVGEAAMNVEMEKGFNRDLTLITILTAVAIFLIVAITFRSLLIPLILVLIVQCGVFMTVCISGIISKSIYYLALLIVQCILMGATIDYGIVFTNYYKENRKTMEIGPSLDIAYGKSLHTIMTSGLIIVLVTGLIGFSPADPAIGQICLTLSFGTLCAILLILFVLPGLIMAFDKFIVKEHKLIKKRPKKVE